MSNQITKIEIDTIESTDKHSIARVIIHLASGKEILFSARKERLIGEGFNLCLARLRHGIRDMAFANEALFIDRTDETQITRHPAVDEGEKHRQEERF